MEKITELTSPPVVGRSYLVPTVAGKWFGKRGEWPIIGPRHEDRKCLDFDHVHYHLDVRFLPDSCKDPEWSWPDAIVWLHVFSAPLMVNSNGGRGDLPPPRMRRRKCRRLVNPDLAAIIARAGGTDKWRCHFDSWRGKQARHDGRGWVCPHRGVPLADQIVTDGAVICPLHLLRICAATGRVLEHPAGIPKDQAAGMVPAATSAKTEV